MFSNKIILQYKWLFMNYKVKINRKKRYKIVKNILKLSNIKAKFVAGRQARNVKTPRVSSCCCVHAVVLINKNVDLFYRFPLSVNGEMPYLFQLRLDEGHSSHSMQSFICWNMTKFYWNIFSYIRLSFTRFSFYRDWSGNLKNLNELLSVKQL